MEYARGCQALKQDFDTQKVHQRVDGKPGRYARGRTRSLSSKRRRTDIRLLIWRLGSSLATVSLPFSHATFLPKQCSVLCLLLVMLWVCMCLLAKLGEIPGLVLAVTILQASGGFLLQGAKQSACALSSRNS